MSLNHLHVSPEYFNEFLRYLMRSKLANTLVGGYAMRTLAIYDRKA